MQHKRKLCCSKHFVYIHFYQRKLFHHWALETFNLLSSSTRMLMLPPNHSTPNLSVRSLPLGVAPPGQGGLLPGDPRPGPVPSLWHELRPGPLWGPLWDVQGRRSKTIHRLDGWFCVSGAGFWLTGLVFFPLQTDKGFDKTMFERQMSVMRGQVSILKKTVPISLVLRLFYFPPLCSPSSLLCSTFLSFAPLARLLRSLVPIHLNLISHTPPSSIVMLHLPHLSFLPLLQPR